MGTVKNAELSMQSVRRLLERNHLAYTIKEDAILFNRRFNRRTGQKSYYYIGFTEGEKKIGRQSIVFGCVDYNVYDEDFAMGTCFRQTMCRLQCLRRGRCCDGHMLPQRNVYRHGLFCVPFPRPFSALLSNRRVQRLVRMTCNRLCRRTGDRLQGLFLCND